MSEGDQLSSVEQLIRERLEAALEAQLREHPMYDRCLLCGEAMRWTDEGMDAHTCPEREVKLLGILDSRLRDLPANYVRGSDRLVTAELLSRCHTAATRRVLAREKGMLAALPAMHPNHAEFFVRNEVAIVHESRWP